MKNAKGRFQKKTWIWASVVAFGFFCLYSTTMPRTNIGYNNSDLFLLFSQKFGLFLPPGYPLYLSLLTLFTHLPLPLSIPAKGHLLSVIFSSLALGIFFLSSSKIVAPSLRRLRSPWPSRLSLLISLISTLTLGLSYYFWVYGQITEKYALSALFTLLLLYLVINFVTSAQIKIKSRSILLFFIIYGFSLSHSYVFIWLLPLIAYIAIKYHRIFTPKYWFFCLLLSLLSFLIPLVSLIIIPVNGATPSWHQTRSLAGWVQYFSRSESFSNLSLPLNSPPKLKPLILTHLTTSVPAFLATLSGSFGVIMIILFALSLYVGFHQFKPIFWPIFISFLGLGLGLAIYLDWNPDWTAAAEILPQLIPGLVAFALILIFGWYILVLRLFKAVSVLLSPLWAFSLVTLILISGFLIAFFIRYPYLNMYGFNQAANRYRQIIMEVPPNALVTCYSSSGCNQLLYLSFVEKLRPDVDIVPLTENLVQATIVKKHLNLFPYPENPMAMIDIVTHNLGLRPVIAVDLNDTYFSLLGLNSPLMYYVPHGSWGELTRQLPKVLPNYPTNFSGPYLSLKASTLDPSRALLKTQPGRDHLLNSQVLIKMDDRDRALAEMNTAVNLFYTLSSAEKKQVDSYRQTIEQTSSDGHFKLGSKVPKASTFLTNIPDLLRNNKLSKAYQNAFAGIVVEPKNVMARLALADILEKIGKTQEALLEYTHVLILDQTNASAAAALNRLSTHSL